MKKSVQIFLATALIGVLNTNAVAQTFKLAPNGVTVTCEGVTVGQTVVVSGVTYTAVDNTTIRNNNIKDYSCLCTSLVTNMYRLFALKTEFNQNISSWDVSNVKFMKGMFKRARRFNKDISSWNVSKVTDMETMFYDAHRDLGPGQFWRKVSMTIQLTDPDDFEGGGLQVEHPGGTEEWVDTPHDDRGDMIMFPSFMRHQALPVTKGTRKCLVAWISGPPLR